MICPYPIKFARGLAEKEYVKNSEIVQKLEATTASVARTLGKQVTFKFVDDASLWLETQSESRAFEAVFNSLYESLMHLIRNAVDHGIDQRGVVTVRASVDDTGAVCVEVSDNGKGIDAKRIRERAIQIDILDPKTTIADQSCLGFIFHPGFSTQDQITEISGRGVGLAVVKSQIEKLDGRIELRTNSIYGTTFSLFVPLFRRDRSMKKAA